jgi:all-trans-retinol 13,14-reductase
MRFVTLSVRIKGRARAILSRLGKPQRIETHTENDPAHLDLHQGTNSGYRPWWRDLEACTMSRSFDAIVIGSGLGGLTAGALCAKSGLRVLVLERNDTFGGAATVYRHNGLAIETSLHEIDGLDEGDPKLPLIQALGLQQRLQFVDVGDLYEVRGGPLERPFVLPHGAEKAVSAAIAAFPHRKAALEEYFRRLLALRGALSVAAHHREDRNWWPLHAPEAVRALWPLLRKGSATLGDVLSDLFGDDEAVKLALAANVVYYHDDPDRLLFLRFAVAQASYVIGGGHYVRGGSQALTDRLVALIRDAGGKLETGREANELIVADGRVTGVRHVDRTGEDEETDLAPIVLGNAAPQLLAAMLPEKKSGRLPRPVRQAPVVDLAVDRVARAQSPGEGAGRPALFHLHPAVVAEISGADAGRGINHGPGAGSVHPALCLR